MTAQKFDLIVIGGGINGAGIARDAARRGLKVALLEKGDFGSGTSSWSSRLIHGGLRYLEYAEFRLVYESLHDRRALLKTAPHLVKPLKITIPIYREARRGKWLVRAGMALYDLLSMGKSLPSHSMQNAAETAKEFPGLADSELRASASYYDAQVVYAERLVYENILDAAAHGADCYNYAEVLHIEREANSVTAVRYRDEASGIEYTLNAAAVVNAAGPWVDSVLECVDEASFPKFMGGTKGSHIIVDRFSGAPESALYSEAQADGRPFFILPWNQQILIGTTDIRDDAPPEELRASTSEIDYLLSETNRLFPDADLSVEKINHSYAGMRPLPRKSDGPESAISRAHVIRHHNKRVRGLYSIIGGKLTTYRSLAIDFLKHLDKDFDLKLEPASTDSALLPGAQGIERLDDVFANAKWLSQATRSHLRDVYGARAREIIELAESDAELRNVICTDTQAIAAEIIFVARHEQCKTLDDAINRRTMIGLGPDRGLASLKSVARLLASEWGWSDADMRKHMDAYSRNVKHRFMDFATT